MSICPRCSARQPGWTTLCPDRVYKSSRSINLAVTMDGLTFEMRIVNIDYYMAAPLPDVDVCYSSLEGTEVDQVPVVRIYGRTPAGQKACLHVHKASAANGSSTVSREGRSGSNVPPAHPWSQAFPYLYVPYDDDLPTEPSAGAPASHGLSFSI